MEKTGRTLVAVLAAYRSPSLIVRLDGEGTVIGELLHFGHINAIHKVDGFPDGRARLLLFGSNDLQEDCNGAFAFVALVDPDVLDGTTEFSATRGFGFPASRAVDVYLRIPFADMNLVDASRPVVRCVLGTDSAWTRILVVSSAETQIPGFEYVLAPDLRVLRIIPLRGTPEFRAKLVEKGFLRGELDDAYLEDLRGRVGYWNGSFWQRGYARVSTRH